MMKESLRILPAKEVKFFRSYIMERWGADFRADFVFLMSNKNRLYIADKGIGLVNFENFRINSIGLYFGEYHKEKLRLSIEGSQIIGPLAKKNIAVIPDELVVSWLRGEDIPFDGNGHGFVIVKNKDDFFGCGNLVDGRILNFVPKARRLVVSDLP